MSNFQKSERQSLKKKSKTLNAHLHYIEKLSDSKGFKSSVNVIFNTAFEISNIFQNLRTCDPPDPILLCDSILRRLQLPLLLRIDYFLRQGCNAIFNANLCRMVTDQILKHLKVKKKKKRRRKPATL